ncbi:MAG TPA: ABC transporter ATP-binding protein [Actinomycetota bacterium]|jgi:ABC-2 type transport system ATP-binding protein|nr:ABC transporter ATP-binding protein [Actinomycetota bacterium]
MGALGHAIETRGLTKVYGSRTRAVDRLDLAVRRGEVYGFLGPNGAGKTTTLRMLLGLIHPTDGTARILGRAPGDPEGLARVGSVVEGPAFYPYLSGRDNLRVVARSAGIPEGRIDAALDAVDLLDRGDDRFGEYSQGMRQRLGVAAALLKEPELLILDEPTNGLDPAGMAEMRSLIRRLGTGDRTVLLSSHLLGEVQQVCDRVGVVSRGELIAGGTVDELRGRGSILVRAQPLTLARERAERVLGPGRVQVLDGSLRLDADPVEAPTINRELVLAGVAVRELREIERTLEDVFLELTGPGGDGDGR